MGRARARCWVLLAAEVLLVVLQGGYYDEVSAAASIVLAGCAAVALLKDAHAENLPSCMPVPVLLCLGLICVALLASAVFNGVTYTSLSACAPWLVLVASLLLAGTCSDAERAGMLRGLGWVGVVAAACGVLMYAGVLPVAGSVNAGRLQFLFQYANTAGVWFAALTLIALCSSDQRLRIAAVLPFIAAVLTLSGGTAVLFGCALAVLAGLALRRRGLSVGVSVLLPAAFLVLIAVVLVAFFPGRVSQAVQTFLERGVQIADAAKLIAGSPLLGLGPGGWSQAYLGAQSAQYTASVVHCGYAQLALDAGLPALAALAVVLCYGMRAAVVRLRGGMRLGELAAGTLGAWGVLLASALLLLHAGIDIDMSFGAFMVLCAMVLPTPARVGGEGSKARVTVGVLAVTLLASGASLWAGFSKDAAVSALNSGRLSEIERVAADPLAAGDPDCRVGILYAWDSVGSGDRAVAFADVHNVPCTVQESVALADCLYAQGDNERAEQVLIDAAERYPYCLDLFELIAMRFEAYGVSDAGYERYQGAADRADGLSQVGNAALLNNQRKVDRFTR